jgi:hypothetical protein
MSINPLSTPTQPDNSFPLGAGQGQDPREKDANNSNLPEQVMVDREEYERMRQDIADLKERGDGIGFEEPELPTCVIYKYNDLFVVRYGKSWEEKTPENEWVLMMEVITADEKGKEYVHTFNINQFRTPGAIDGVEIVEAKIVGKKQLAPTVIRQGNTTLKDVKYDQFKTVDTGISVPLRVNIPNDIMVLELPDRTVIELPTSAIN